MEFIVFFFQLLRGASIFWQCQGSLKQKRLENTGLQKSQIGNLQPKENARCLTGFDEELFGYSKCLKSKLL